MSRKSWIVAIATVALMGLVLSTGCAQIAEQAAKSAVEGATGVKVEDDGVTMKGENGETVSIGGENKLPDGFPTEVPVYEGAITSSVATEKGFLVGIETSDAPKTVLEWYKTQLTDAGWEVKSTLDAAEGGMLTATTTGLSVVVNVGGGEKTSIVLSAEKK